MGSLLERNPSLWVATSDRKQFVSVPTGARFDVVVVGAGITGPTTARLLAADGASVAVLEAGEVAAGATGYTSAKVSALQRTTLGDLRGQHGQDRVAAYAAANAAAVETVARVVEDDDIDCDFERAAACTYATDPGAAADIEKEHEAAIAAGLNSRLGGCLPRRWWCASRRVSRLHPPWLPSRLQHSRTILGLPLHGSCFGVDGRVLQGPAVKDLSVKGK